LIVALFFSFTSGNVLLLFPRSWRRFTILPRSDFHSFSVEMQARIGVPARVGRGIGGATPLREKPAVETPAMRARPRPRSSSLVVSANKKSAPPSTTYAPRPPGPPSTALPGGGGSSSSPPRTPPPQHLDDPIAIAASATRTLAVPDRARSGGGGEEDLSLDAYMRLPPSAYAALDPDLIRRGGGGGGSPLSSSSEPSPPSSVPIAFFTLAIPRASMLGIWLEPVISVRVEGASSPSPSGPEEGRSGSAGGATRHDRVRLVSTACDLRGSPAVQRLRINEVFALRFEAVLTWTAGGAVSARVRTEVWAEPVGPFRFVPRGAIVAAGDALLRGLTGALLPSFLGKLGKDYERWAGDPAVRAARQAMARDAEEGEEERRRGGSAAAAKC